MPEIKSKFIECYIYRAEGRKIKYLILKRSPDNKLYPGIWQIVTGRIEEKETAMKTALRELQEETGIIPKRFFVIPRVSNFYSWKSDNIHLIPLFLAETDKTDIVLSDEHSEYLWAECDKALNNVYWASQKENLVFVNEHLLNENLKKTLIEVNLSNL